MTINSSTVSSASAELGPTIGSGVVVGSGSSEHATTNNIPIVARTGNRNFAVLTKAPYRGPI